MKKIYYITAVMLCIVMYVCGCSSNVDAGSEKEPVKTESEKTPEKKEEKKEEKEYQGKLDMIDPSAYDNVDGLTLEEGTTLSVIGKAEGVPYWDEVRKGAEQAVEDINENLGYEGKDRVKLTYSAPAAADDVDEQVNILDEELARYPAALAIAIVDTKACEVQFDLAAESDIPVVAFDSGSAYQGLLATVETDNLTAAQEAAQRLAEQLQDSGEVLMFVHDSKSESAINRENGFKEEMAENHPDITVAEVFYMDQLPDMQKIIAEEINAGTYRRERDKDPDPEQDLSAEKEEVPVDSITEDDVIDYILAKHPEAGGCYATNGDAVRLALTLQERGGADISIIGYDADEDEIEALKDGKIEALLLQNPFGMGYAAVVASARAALSMGNEAVVDTGYTWITKENLEEENIQKLLY